MGMFKKIHKKYIDTSMAAKASMWFVICGFLQRGISVITTPIFTRLLTPEEFGVYSIFNTWMAIITILVTLKLGFGVYIQGLVKFAEDKERFSSSILGLATVWWACFFAIYLFFKDFWNRLLGLTTFFMVCMFIMIIVTVAFTLWAGGQRNDFKYINLVKVTILVSVLNPLFGIIAVLLTETLKVEARVGALTGIALLAYSGFYFHIIRKGKKFINVKYWKYALMFNIPLVPHFLSQVILNHSDRIMIQQLVGFREAGIYTLAYSIAMILTILNTSIQNSFRPWVFQNLKMGKSEKIRSVGLSVIVIVGICNLLLISFGPEVVAIFAPPAFREATNLLAPITMGVYFAFLYNLFADVQMYYEKTKSIMVVSIICASISIALNLYFIPIFGYMAAAYTTLFSYMLMTVLHYFAMERVIKRNHQTIKIYKLKTVVIVSLVFLIAGALLGSLFEHFAIRLAIVTIGFIFIYCNRGRFRGIMGLMKMESASENVEKVDV